MNTLSFSLIKSARRRVVGAKETLKALEKGEAKIVVAARDAENRVIQPVLDLSESRGVEVRYVEGMKELGKACGIKVGAAVAAITEL